VTPSVIHGRLRLSIAEAAMVEASVPPNPTFSISRLQTPVELDIERRIIMDILALATLRRAPSSPPNVSVRRSCIPPWKPCGSALRHAKPTTARSPEFGFHIHAIAHFRLECLYLFNSPTLVSYSEVFLRRG
jgi:hypothetical protein